MLSLNVKIKTVWKHRTVMKEITVLIFPTMNTKIVQTLERINDARNDSNKGINSYLKNCLSFMVSFLFKVCVQMSKSETDFVIFRPQGDT